MNGRPPKGSGPLPLERDQRTERVEGESVGGPGRHRAPTLLERLRDRGAAALGRLWKRPASAPPDASQTGLGWTSRLPRHVATKILACLDTLDGISERRQGGIEIAIDGDPLIDRQHHKQFDHQQLFDALAQDCQVLIRLGQSNDGTPEAVFQDIADFIEVLTLETRAEIVLDFPDPKDREQFKLLWQQLEWWQQDGILLPMPPFLNPTQSDP